MERTNVRLRKKAGDFYRLKEKKVQHQVLSSIQSLKLGTKSHL